MKTVIEIIWDEKYVASSELASLAQRVWDKAIAAYFPDGVPPWARVNVIEDADG